MKLSHFAIAVGALSLSACEQAPETNAPSAESFQEALTAHTAAVTSKDYQGVVDTITKGDDLSLIFPDGSMRTTREEFLGFHKEWFTDEAWVFTMDQVSTDIVGNYGWALYRTSFDPDGEGDAPARFAFLTIGFQWEDGEWRLVHDQNTRIESPKAE